MRCVFYGSSLQANHGGFFLTVIIIQCADTAIYSAGVPTPIVCIIIIIYSFMKFSSRQRCKKSRFWIRNVMFADPKH